MAGFYDNLDWKTMLKQYNYKHDFNISDYYKILSPYFPEFLHKYIKTPAMQRLSGIGLLCGTDYTKLYKNNFYYSRLDHSVGVALIVWNFTKDKAQTLSGLFHDISTPVFSHVAEFRKGDALTQSASEDDTEAFIKNDKEILKLLKEDDLTLDSVKDYHLYPIADNERPQLSADRLEYMFPSGAALQGSWTLSEIENVYNDITILQNEFNIPELGFNTLEKAEIYTEKFLETGHVIQLNENKLALQLLAEICQKAINLNKLSEEDCYNYSESEILKKFEKIENEDFQKYFKTYKNMSEIVHSDKPLENHFCINLKVKQRYINPLVKTANGSKRISEISEKSSKLIEDFLRFEDSKFGCVRFID